MIGLDMDRGYLAALMGVVGLYTALAGLYFDIAYHHVFPFEAFWSNPHILMYSGLALAFLVGGYLLLDPGLRRGFGGLTIRILGMEISPYTLLYSLSCISALLAGYLDSIWHGIWGSFESSYSYPHTLALTSSITAALVLVTVLVREYRASILASSIFLAGIGMALFRTFIGPFSNPRALFEELASGTGLGHHFEGESTLLWEKYLEKGLYAENPLLAPLVVALVYGSVLILAYQYTEAREAVLYTGFLVTGLMLIFYFSVDLAGYNPVYRSPLALSAPVMALVIYLLGYPRGYFVASLVPGFLHILLIEPEPQAVITSFVGGALAIAISVTAYRGLVNIGRWTLGLVAVFFLAVPAILGYADIYIRFL